MLVESLTVRVFVFGFRKPVEHHCWTMTEAADVINKAMTNQNVVLIELGHRYLDSFSVECVKFVGKVVYQNTPVGYDYTNQMGLDWGDISQYYKE